VGLDSLAAVQLVTRLEQQAGRTLSPSIVFEYPTIDAIASHLFDTSRESAAARTLNSIPPAEAPAAGWVRSNRQAVILSDKYFPTIWYSLPTSLPEASEAFRTHLSLRTSFVRDLLTNNWKWVIKSEPLPIYDADHKALVFTDRTMPVFYESSMGLLWLNHTVWDAFSVLSFATSRLPSRHFERVARMHAGWEGGHALVDGVLRGPKLFDRVSPFVFSERSAELPFCAVHMVKDFCARSQVQIESAWHAIMMVLALQCAQKNSAVFWIQASNRDSENSDVFGYVTTEVGLLVVVDAEAPFALRLQQCLRALAAISAEHRNVFPEIAMAHPMNDNFLEVSLGINLIGSRPDDTDRRLVYRAVAAASNVAGHKNGTESAFFGNMNWLEIGNERNNTVTIHGRVDIVHFCVEKLMPALCQLPEEALLQP
jgi:hypothetical protein